MTNSEEKLRTLLNDKPRFHDWSDVPPTSAEVLEFIYRNLNSDMTTLETGAGHSTVVFAIAGTNHVCIDTGKQECERIAGYCSNIGVDTSRIAFINRSSDAALSRSETTPPQLDFIFIDGAHRFPFPIIDYHYTEGRLKIGGILGVDDFTMPSVRILYDFLRGEDEWEIVEEIGETAFFRRVSETRIVSDWQGQNINRQANWRIPDSNQATSRGAPHPLSSALNRLLRIVRRSPPSTGL